MSSRIDDIVRYVRNEVGPWYKSNGWLRNPTMEGWHKEVDCGFFVISFSVRRWDLEQFSGAISFYFWMQEVNPKIKRYGRSYSRRVTCNMSEVFDEVQEEQFLETQTRICDEVEKSNTVPAQWLRIYSKHKGSLNFFCQEDLLENFNAVREHLEQIQRKVQAKYIEKIPDAQAVKQFESADYTPWNEIQLDSENDEPRLVYADWLEENGDPRGEFIRIQCQYSSLPPGSPERMELKKKSNALLREHGDNWFSRMAKAPFSGAKFHRGFVSEVQTTAKRLMEKGDKIFEFAPLINFVRITKAWDCLVELGECEHLQKLTAVGFAEKRHFHEESWKQLLDSPNLINLTEIHLQNRGIGLINLFESSLLRQLRFINFRLGGLSEPLLRAFVSVNPLSNLRKVSIAGNKLFSEAANQLANSTSFPALEDLDLSSNRVGNKGLNYLLESDGLSNLKVLRIANTHVTTKGIDALLKDHNLKSLEAVRTYGNNLTPKTIERLSERYRVIEENEYF